MVGGRGSGGRELGRKGVGGAWGGRGWGGRGIVEEVCGKVWRWGCVYGRGGDSVRKWEGHVESEEWERNWGELGGSGGSSKKLA